MVAHRLSEIRMEGMAVLDCLLRRATLIKTRLRRSDAHKSDQRSDRDYSDSPAHDTANATQCSPSWLQEPFCSLWLQSKHVDLVPYWYNYARPGLAAY
jgi:hypothetical protein